MKKLRNDLILIAVVLLIALILIPVPGFFRSRTTGADPEVLVLYDGKETGRYPLSESATVTIENGEGGINILIIEDGACYVTEANCSEKICIAHGKIRYAGECIVCLPNKVVIEIVNGEESNIDAVAE